jgi:hypothetical protein
MPTINNSSNNDEQEKREEADICFQKTITKIERE